MRPRSENQSCSTRNLPSDCFTTKRSHPCSPRHSASKTVFDTPPPRAVIVQGRPRYSAAFSTVNSIKIEDNLRQRPGPLCYHQVSMTADLELVSRLQTLDKEIGDLQREVAALPKHIAQIEKTLDGHNRRLEADRAALTANQKERKRLEDDVKVQEQKISKLRDQMLGAKTNEQYRAFQNEIEYSQREIRKYEDRILDLMGESEPLDLNVKKAEAALKEEKQQVEGEKNTAREATAKDEKRLAELQEERKAAVAGLKPQVYRDYERIRKKWHGSALAE